MVGLPHQVIHIPVWFSWWSFTKYEKKEKKREGKEEVAKKGDADLPVVATSWLHGAAVKLGFELTIIYHLKTDSDMAGYTSLDGAPGVINS